MGKFIVVTAADAKYFSLLQGLVASLKVLGEVPIRVLDLGLEKTQLGQLKDQGISTVIPGWDIEIRNKTVQARHGGKIPLPDHFRAFTAQPFLPKYAPDHDIILWIDADCWVQDPRVIDLYLDEATRGRMAVSLEVDRCYTAPYWRLRSHIPNYISAFGLKQGWTLARKASANAGVLALKSDAPHWKLWQDATRRAMHRPHQRSQQMALNYVIHIDKAPSAFLPAYCNWQSWESTPLWDRANNLLVEPQPPYHPIGIMHNAQEDKNAKFRVGFLRDDQQISRTMRYEDWQSRVEAQYPDDGGLKQPIRDFLDTSSLTDVVRDHFDEKPQS